MPLTRAPTTSSLPKAATAARSFTSSTSASTSTSTYAHPFIPMHPTLTSTGAAANSSSPTRKIAAAGAAAGILLCGVGAASRAGARAAARRGVVGFEGQGKNVGVGGVAMAGSAGVSAVQHESRRKMGEAAAERQEWAIRQGTDVFW